MADTVSDRIPEWRLQVEIAADLDRRISEGQPFDYAASLEGVIGNLNSYQAQKAAAQGVKRGEPDIRLYFGAARIVFVELKADKGYLSTDQKVRIPILRDLGFTVHVVKATTCEGAVNAMGVIVGMELGAPGSSAFLETATYFPKVRK